MILKYLKTSSKKLVLNSFLVFIFCDVALAKGMPKEYYEIKNSEKSKEYFLNHLHKLVIKENNRILEERNFIKKMLSSNILTMNYNSLEFKKLLEIKKRYKVKKLFTLSSYLKKIDVFPPSLVLAQAAVESGWGKSRFIKEANNIFGHWTYNPKIGMLPKQRDVGATHFIRVFKTLEESVRAYMLNLNRNLAYKSFRNKRLKQRQNQKPLDGLELSQTMLNYSGIADEYLKILKNVIERNDLKRFDSFSTED